MSRTRRAMLGAGSLAGQFVLRTAATIIVTPLIVRVGGSETLGAYSVVMQLLAYMQLLDAGMTTAIGREVARVEGAGTAALQRLSELSVTGGAFLLGVGLVAAAGTVEIAATLPHWLHAAPAVQASAKSALLLFAAWMPLRFAFSYASLLLMGRQQIAQVGIANAVGESIRSLLMLALVWAGYGLPGLAIATIVAEFVTFALCTWWARRTLAALNWRGRPHFGILKALLVVSMPLGLMSLGDRLTFYTQDIVSGSLFGAGPTAALYATRAPGFLLASVLWRMLDSILPGINELHAGGFHGAFRAAYWRAVGYSIGSAAFVSVGVLAFNPAIVTTWVGAKLYLGASATAAIACVVLVATFKNVTTKFIITEGRLGTYAYVVLVEGAVTILLSIGLGRLLGVAGIIWASVAAQVVTVWFLVARSARIVSEPQLIVVRRLLGFGVRCAGGGALCCAAYAAARFAGWPVPWPVALLVTLVLGSASFAHFGLLPGDRTLLYGFWTRLTRCRVPVR